VALKFEYEKDLTTGAQPYIAHELDSTIYNYFVDDERAMDRKTFVPQGVYDNVEFTDLQSHLTTRAVSRIGIKHFPGIGAIGFYKDAYNFENRIIAPIHSRLTYYKAPKLVTAAIEENKLHIVIEPPEDITYNCYRIIARQGSFAFEYITYKLDYMVDLPTVRGTYEVYCMGYDEDNGTVSEDSNIIELELTNGTPGWSPWLDAAAALETDLSTLRIRVDGLDEKAESLEENVTTLDETIVALDERLEFTDEQMHVLEENIEMLDVRAGALEEDALFLAEQIDATEAHVTEVETFVNESMDGIETIIDEINQTEEV